MKPAPLDRVGSTTALSRAVPSPETPPIPPAAASSAADVGCPAGATPSLDFRWLGRIGFTEALALQDSLVAERRRGEIVDTVLLLEHDPVYTIGRTRDRSSLRDDPGALPHPVVEINRGGQATWHGPGQLVGYLILDLHGYGCDLHRYLRALEAAQIAFLRGVGVEKAGRREGLTGVWVGDHRKISSIGVGARRWVTMHGFALNVSHDLSGFESIVPCGIDGVEMTSLEGETGRDWTVETVAESIRGDLAREVGALASRGQKP